MNLSSSQRKNISSEQTLNGDRRSIDNLPDVVLEHILSFLPTKDAFRATILSKRWQHLLISLPNLDFDEGAPERRSIFMNFVDKVIGIHNSSSIRDFSLSCNVLSDASRISKWVTHAVNHKPERLHLWLKEVEEPFLLPPHLFASETLVSLSIIMYHDLKVPSDICFSSLKTLRLRNVIFLDDPSTQMLFSSCPVLEELAICNCRWWNVKAISICLPMLRELEMEDHILIVDDDDDDDCVYEGDCVKVKDNHNDFHCCHFMIFGTNLESFSFSGQVRYEYCLYNTSSLVDATLELSRNQTEYMPKMTNDYAFHVYKLLRDLSNVESLKVSDDIFEAVEHAKELFATLPVFPNLTYLDIIGIGSEVDISCNGLVALLQKFAYLETMEFSFGISLESRSKDEAILDPIPSCFSTYLKTIRINFTGDDSEIEAVRILLERATCLESMIIFFCLNKNKLEDVQKQLLLLPKRSNCEFEFYLD